MAIPFADAIFWIAVASCLVAQIAIVRSVLRMRGQTPANGLPRPRTAIEIAWVIIPGVALAGVLVMTWGAIHRAAPPTDRSGTGRVANEAPALSSAHGSTSSTP